MNSKTKTIILLICLTMIYSLNSKSKAHSATKAKSKSKIHSLAKNKIQNQNQNKNKITNKNLIQDKSNLQVQLAANKQTNSTSDSQSTTHDTKPTPVTTNYGAPISDTNSQVTITNPNLPNVNQKDYEENDKFFNQRNIVCSTKNCVAPYGFCSDNNTVCKCLSGYANYVPEGESSYDYYCTYKQKKQIIAFLMEFFVSLGTGHFYSGRILFGVFKLLIMLGPLILSVLMCCTAMLKDRDSSTCMGLFVMIGSCTFVCGGLIWQLVDVILFGINSYKDGNGVPLEHW